MARMSRLLARIQREPFADVPIAEHVNQVLTESGHVWRERLLPPLVMLRLFVIQILSGNCSIAALRQLGGIDFATSSYSDARMELPLQLLQSLLRWMHGHAEKSLGIATRLIGQRIFISDGSGYTMPDTRSVLRSAMSNSRSETCSPMSSNTCSSRPEPTRLACS